MFTGKDIKKEARSATGRDTGKSELHHLRCRVVSFSKPPHLKISIESPLGPSLCLSFSSCREFVGCVFGFMWGRSRGRTWRCYFIPGQHPHPVYLKEGSCVFPAQQQPHQEGNRVFSRDHLQWSFFCLASIICLTLFNSQGPHLKIFNISLFFNMLTQYRVSR